MTTRKAFLRELGRTTAGVLVFGAACTSQGPAGSPSPSTTTTPATTTTGAPTTSEPVATTTSAAPEERLAWDRVNLGFVSAYLLSRAGEVAVVDTGVSGSEDAIESALAAIGSDWNDVAHVILTHRHGDHVGSLPAVLGRAPGAAVYAGTADIPAIESPKAVTAVTDGELVFGLQVVATPGHTEGHIAVLDPLGSLLVAGDALNGAPGGGVAGPNPQFTPDMAKAADSVRKLAQLEFDAIVFGHGDPVIGGASEAVRRLAGGL